CSKGVTSLDVW
nr:immunoglobulin heavy chain junction region [Macaca mulatta]